MVERLEKQATRGCKQHVTKKVVTVAPVQMVTLRALNPTLRGVVRACRQYHPHVSSWGSPPSANLVPIVIEQTVRPHPFMYSPLMHCLFGRDEGNAHMISFRVF